MAVTLLLLWFPIVLAVGLGGRLLRKGRGLALGLLCALFWVAMLQATNGLSVWQESWSVLTVVSGSLAIVMIGGWAETFAGEPRQHPATGSGVRGNTSVEGRDALSGPQESALERVNAAIDQFDDWIDHHRDDRDPWPKFDELVRSVMHRCCHAVHVQSYRLCSDNGELTSLREPGPLERSTQKVISARGGIVGHVITTGRAFVAGDRAQGPLVEKLAASSSDSPAWCFAITHGNKRIGAVVVGRLRIDPQGHSLLFEVLERLINQFWGTLAEVCTSRTAVLDDPVSGLHARDAFLRAASHSLANSYQQCEPVAVAVIALERLRELNDAGRWELADQLLREVGDTLRRKLRTDDELGRFDGSRFVLLLRRVDSHLATLIVTQVLSQLEALCGDTKRWGTTIVVRCGIVGSGTDKPDLRSLVSRALGQCHRARTEGVPTASDLQPVEPAGALA